MAAWIERVAVLERELGRIEGRLRITEVAECTLREQLQRERAGRVGGELRSARLSWWQRWLGPRD
jgi:hypothetical protein